MRAGAIGCAPGIDLDRALRFEEPPFAAAAIAEYQRFAGNYGAPVTGVLRITSRTSFAQV